MLVFYLPSSYNLKSFFFLPITSTLSLKAIGQWGSTSGHEPWLNPSGVTVMDNDILGYKINKQIFSEFLHKEYGGPGTLLVEPFTDMLVALKEKKLPGAPLAARASLLWAQNYVDQDWEVWNLKPKPPK
ncbi:Protein plastid redox insensitive 2, chloroplastic [Vitis vinifera]|uniref:Protein plastid redox insensitive 2, chloroplastic n=1 Tax=Vitis vinifera TaxID=29760 RepID=A0A438JNT4_VITVI|nr:Protein plastid redox insensitive 2, chloroplastic [Vitis vinifera]